MLKMTYFLFKNGFSGFFHYLRFGWTGYFRFENVMNIWHRLKILILVFLLNLIFSFAKICWNTVLPVWKGGSGFKMILSVLWSRYFYYFIFIINKNVPRDLNVITSGLVHLALKCHFRFQNKKMCLSL